MWTFLCTREKLSERKLEIDVPREKNKNAFPVSENIQKQNMFGLEGRHITDRRSLNTSPSGAKEEVK